MKIRSPRVLAIAALGAALACTGAMAQTLYKLIDKNGKITYSESPPKDFDGKVIRMDIDPKANTATLPRARGESSPAKASTSAGSRDAVRLAQEKLDAAKKALQDAKDNPREDEVQRVGTTKGFTRPVPTEGYQKRLEALEADVRKAEEELRVAQGR